MSQSLMTGTPYFLNGLNGHEIQNFLTAVKPTFTLSLY